MVETTMNVANIRIGVVQNDMSQEPRIVLSCTGETFMRVDFNLVEFRQLIKRESAKVAQPKIARQIEPMECVPVGEIPVMKIVDIDIEGL